jgi:hypothetical protein
MKKGIITLVLLFAACFAGAALPAAAQASQPPFPVTLEKQLAERASNYTEVTLDRKMLDFASRFMNDKDDAEGKRIVEKLNGVYVRSYEFEKPGQYTPADLDAVRKQFDTAEWSTLVKTRSKDASDDADIYMKLVNGEVHPELGAEGTGLRVHFRADSAGRPAGPERQLRDSKGQLQAGPEGGEGRQGQG